MSKLFQHILDFPTAYRSFQRLVSPKESIPTHKILAQYIEEKFPEHKIIDIGCGDAIMASFLKEESDYIGLDYNPEYIKKAKEKYPGFDFRIADVSEIDPGSNKVIYILMGVVHHLDDNQVKELFTKIMKTNPEALIFCFDGVRLPKQNIIATLMMDLDRGNHVRTFEGYGGVLEGFNFIVRSDLLALPYNHILSAYNFNVCELNDYMTEMRAS